MSVGGATHLEQLERTGEPPWLALADDIGVRPAFVTRIRDEVAERAVAATFELLRADEHGNEMARYVGERVISLATP